MHKQTSFHSASLRGGVSPAFRITALLAVATSWLATAPQTAAGWSHTAWTNDASSGVDSNHAYTCAVNMNGGQVTINGVTFDPHAAAERSGRGWSVPAGDTWSSHAGVGGDLNITGQGALMGNPFMHGGRPRNITLSGLTAGKAYRTTFFAYGWGTVGTRIQQFRSNGEQAAIDQSAYGQYEGISVSYTFVADASVRAFVINPIDGNPTRPFHMSGVANHEIPVPRSYWTSAPWTGDADSGIDGTYTYTCAVNFNGGAVSVNGAAFDAHNGTARSGSGWSVGAAPEGLGRHAGRGANLNMTGNSTNLANPFIYNANPRTVTITGLTPGRRYITTFYAFGWEGSGRTQTFASGSDSAFIDQDGFGNNNGIRISYVFVADGASKSFSIAPTGGTFHMSGLSNREARRTEPMAFTRRQRISFPNYTGTQTLTNFPVLVTFRDGVNGFDYSELRSDGADLRFSEGNGTSTLDYEIEEWNTGGVSYAWVRVPVFTNNTAIYAYWGNDSLDGHQASQTDGSVWIADYAAVWHLDRVGAAEDLTDATANGHDGTDNGDSYSVAGVISDGQRFDTSDGGDYVSVGYSPDFGLNTFTVSSWVRIASEPTTSYGILGTRIGGEQTFDLKVRETDIHGDVGGGGGWISTTVDIGAADTGSNGQGGDLTVGQWYLVSYVIDNAAKQFRLFLNGDLKRTIGFSGTPLLMKSGQSLWIGDDYVRHEYMNGTLDEVRVSGAARSAGWVLASYSNQCPGSAFASYGAAEDTGPDPVEDGKKRMRITFANYVGTETLTNFPVLVVLEEGSNGFTHADCESGGRDLRFTAADGVTPLSREVEEWNIGGKSYVWVRVPEVSAAAAIWAYWGSGRTLHPLSQSDGSVWSRDYAGVWHLDQDGGVEDLADSTAYANDAVIDGDTDNTAGRISMGQNFDGGSDYIQIVDSPSLSVTGDLTVSAWINGSSFPAGSQQIVAKDAESAYRCRIQDNGTTFWALLCDGVGARPYEIEQVSCALAAGTWYHAAVRADFGSGVVRFYVDGVQIGGDQATSEGGLADTSGPLVIGNHSARHTLEDFVGVMDEVRITDGLRSGDWLHACWLNVASNRHFNTYTDSEANRPPTVDNASGATNALVASASLNGTLVSDGGDTAMVRVYYGPSDGQTTGANWQTSEFFGTDVAEGPLTTNVTGLLSDTDYFYRFWASNAVSDAWANASATFYTRFSAAQTPSNLVASTGIERTLDLTWEESAVHASGFMVEYWKTAGGPTNSVLADSGGGNTTSVTVRGLDHSTEYTFRVAATNSANGDATAFSATDSATTIAEIDPIADADHRMRITFPNYTGERLANFPVLIVVSNGLHGVDYGDFETGGTDLRFTAADGVTPINHEVENWGTGTDKSYVWVQVPSFSGSSVIWAYWGSGKPYYPASQTNGSVWSENYAGVWHLDETDGVEDLADSTAFDNNATLDADTDNITGIVAKAQYFDGGNDYISIPDSPSVSVTGDLTLAAWIHAETFLGGSQNIIAKDGNASYRYRIQQGGTVFWTLIKDAGPLETESVLYAFESNTWYHAVTKVDFSTREVSFFINGAQVGTPQATAKTNINDSAGALLIGNYAAGHAGEDFIGIIDEVRVTDGIRSDDWINASYMTVASNAAFIGYEDAQALVPDAPRVLIVDGATNVLDTSAHLTATLTSTGGAPAGVWLYWGESDEGDSWGTWADSRDLGAVVSAPPVDYEELVSGLTPATQYYYAYRATNSHGEDWLTAPFKTAGPSEIDNGTGALPGVGYATLRGNLVDTNRAATTVRVYWGENPGAWAHTNDLGVLGNGPFSTITTADLLFGVTYYYRCYATNAYGETWATGTESFGTLLPREQSGWTTDPWNNDADSGITNDHTYTVAVNMKGPQVAINGVSFQTHTRSGANFSIGGPDATYNNHTNNVTGDGAVMANDFIYGGGGARIVTISNLTAGTQYRTTFFGVGFDAVVSRPQLFSATGGDAVIVDENIYGISNGLRQAYTFVADASGVQEFTVTEQVLNRSFHMYGLANRVVEPRVGIENEDVAGITETTATLNGTLLATGAVFDVYVYWGPSDGTNNPSTWGDSAYIGSYTNLGTVPLSHPVTGLSADTNYYTFRATNALVDLWAEPSERFMRLGPPAVMNRPASSAAGYASLNGDLTAGGVADVIVYWGPSDGGSNKTAWAHTNTMGQLLTGTFSTNTTPGLLYGLTYYYRCYATNSIGHDWADSSATFLTLSHSESTGWETNRWVDDLTADIDGAHAYNVAVNLAGAPVNVNGVDFQGHALTGPNFSVSGLGLAVNNDVNDVFGGSATLANDFRYNGNPGMVVISNLTAGTYYRTTFYGVGYGPAGNRIQTFDAEGDGAVIDEHLYGNDNGMRASYTFAAGGSGAKTYTITPHGAPTFHLYALSSREVPLSEMLDVLNEDATAVTTNSATINATLHASNAVFDVHAYWGPVDRTNDANEWARSVYIGSYTNIAGQALAHPIAGLTNNTTYYFNFQATNTAGEIWGNPRGSFATLGVPVVSNVPASGVTVASATLNGELISGTRADATVYWGMTDGETNAALWANTGVVGAVSVGLPFSTSVTVRAGGTYYYRCYATNAYGSDWADETVSFNTPQATLSIADTSVMEGNGGMIDATFDVTLSAACASNVTVNFAAVGGTATAGSDFAATNGVLTIASGVTTGRIVVPVIGDIEEEQPSEAFLVNLSNLSGAAMGDGTAIGTIEDDDLGTGSVRCRMKITFSGYSKAETLTNFPALVMFGTNLTGFAYDQFASPTGGDLRFGNASETRFLDYEIEKWDSAGQSYAWVRIPELVGTDTYIWAYWGNEADTNAPPCTTNGSVWAPAFEAVYHLGSSGGIEDLTDATVNGFDLGDNGDTVNTVAKIGDGQSFDGLTDYLTGTCPAALGGNVDFTVSWWIRHSTQPNRIWAMDFGTRGAGAYHALINPDGMAQLGVWGGAQNQPNIAFHRETWLHMTTVHSDGDTLKTYLNGVEADSDTGVSFTINATGGFRIGQNAGGDSLYKGDVDEVRLSSTARSPDWVWASWNSQAHNTSFCGYGIVDDTKAGTLILVR